MVIPPSTKVYLDTSTIINAGRGVFANTAIHTDETIEVCPVIVISRTDVEQARKTILRNYYFLWGKHKDQVAICLGFGSLYNHSYEPNATYDKHFDTHTIEFRALQAIRVGEEITVNYNFGNPDDKSPLWISDIPDYNKMSMK